MPPLLFFGTYVFIEKIISGIKVSGKLYFLLWGCGRLYYLKNYGREQILRLCR